MDDNGGAPGSAFKTVGLGIVVGVGFLFLPYVMTQCDPGTSAALAALNDCAPAAAALGEPIAQSAVGMACGSSETTGGFGHSQWRLPVHGSRGTGVLRFAAESHGGAWQVLAADLEVGDRRLGVVPCGANAPADGSESQASTATCESGNAEKCLELAAAYERGDGRAKDLGKAAEHYERACTAGSGRGCGSWGYFLFTGQGVPRDVGRARAVLQAACDGQAWLACMNLGAIHTDRQQPFFDPARSVALFRRACDAGFAPSCSNLGVLLRDGLGVQPDVARAVELFVLACDRGVGEGCDHLAAHYRQLGDLELAARYRAQACRAGLSRACE